MQITRFPFPNPHWSSLVAHLEAQNMKRWVLDDSGHPLRDVYFIVAIDEDAVVGHIAVKSQPIIIPATDGGQDTAVTDSTGAPLHETFVQTFAVEPRYRRQGCGRALQVAALDLTAQLNCYQMRSWSSVDKDANYTLKLSLGFAFHPAIDETPTGLKVRGGYFVKTVPTRSH